MQVTKFNFVQLLARHLEQGTSRVFLSQIEIKTISARAFDTIHCGYTKI